MRQAIAKALVAFYQKFVDEAAKREIKNTLMEFDRTLLVADPRRPEPKKYVFVIIPYLAAASVARVQVWWSWRSLSLPKVVPLSVLVVVSLLVTLSQLQYIIVSDE